MKGLLALAKGGACVSVTVDLGVIYYEVCGVAGRDLEVASWPEAALAPGVAGTIIRVWCVRCTRLLPSTGLCARPTWCGD